MLNPTFKDIIQVFKAGMLVPPQRAYALSFPHAAIVREIDPHAGAQAAHLGHSEQSAGKCPAQTCALQEGYGQSGLTREQFTFCHVSHSFTPSSSTVTATSSSILTGTVGCTRGNYSAVLASENVLLLHCVIQEQNNKGRCPGYYTH